MTPHSNCTVATALHYNLIEASQACARCDSTHMPHCTHQQPASSWQFWAEQTCVPSFISSQHTFFSIFFPLIFSLDIMFRLCALMASWNCISSAHNTLSATLATYQNQVSEFAKELLILQEYFSHDPNYWVSSGLVDSTVSQDTLFEATCSACNPKTGLSSQAAAARLFNAHFTFVHSFREGIVLSDFSGDLPDPLTFDERHAQVLQDMQSLRDWHSHKGKGRA